MAQERQGEAPGSRVARHLKQMYGIIDSDTWIEVVNGLTNHGHIQQATRVYVQGMSAFCPYGRAHNARLEALRQLAAANLYVCRQSYQENTEAYSKALRAARAAGGVRGDAVYEAHVERCWGAWLAFIGSTDEAIPKLEKALQLLRSLGDTNHQFVVATSYVLAKCYLDQKTSESHAKRYKKVVGVLESCLWHMRNEYTPISGGGVTEYHIRACMLLGKVLWWQGLRVFWWRVTWEGPRHFSFFGGNFQKSREWREAALAVMKRREASRYQPEDGQPLPKHMPGYWRAFWLRWLPVLVFELIFGRHHASRPEI